MKRYCLTGAALLWLLCSAYSGEFSFHLGGGYAGYFTGSDPEYPGGFALFGGGGYAFAPGWTLGAEYEFSRSRSFKKDPQGGTYDLNEQLFKGFFRLPLPGEAALTLTGGTLLQDFGNHEQKESSRWAPFGGLRLNYDCLYLQYAMVFREGGEHRLGAGVVLTR